MNGRKNKRYFECSFSTWTWKSNPFQANASFLHPWKHAENRWLSGVPRLFRKGTLVWCGLKNFAVFLTDKFSFWKTYFEIFPRKLLFRLLLTEGTKKIRIWIAAMIPGNTVTREAQGNVLENWKIHRNETLTYIIKQNVFYTIPFGPAFEITMRNANH